LGLFLIAGDGFTYQSLASRAGPGFFLLGFPVPTAWSVFLICIAIKRLRKPPASWWSRVTPLPIIRFLQNRLRDNITKIMEPAWEQPHIPFLGISNPLWWRARQARVYDRAGYVALVQGGAWLAVYGFIVLLMIYDRRSYLDFQSTQMFLIPLWVGVTVLTASL